MLLILIYLIQYILSSWLIFLMPKRGHAVYILRFCFLIFNDCVYFTFLGGIPFSTTFPILYRSGLQGEADIMCLVLGHWCKVRIDLVQVRIPLVQCTSDSTFSFCHQLCWFYLLSRDVNIFNVLNVYIVYLEKNCYGFYIFPGQ